jgi:hypothetical protein
MKKLVTGAARLAALALVPFSLFAQPQKADALLSFYIFEQGNTTKIKTIGSLTLPTSNLGSTDSCSAAGINLISSSSMVELSTGNSAACATKFYVLAGLVATPPFAGTVTSGGSGGVDNSNYVSIFTDLTDYYIDLSQGYIPGTSIINEVTFNNPITTPLSGSGLIAEWKIMDGITELDQVKVFLSTPPSAAAAPAPLPLAGGALALGWSRRLRRRAGKAAFSFRG